MRVRRIWRRAPSQTVSDSPWTPKIHAWSPEDEGARSIAWDLNGQYKRLPCDFRPGGVVWTCPYRADKLFRTDNYACSGDAVIIAFAADQLTVFACATHESWLRRHHMLSEATDSEGAKYWGEGVQGRVDEGGVWRLIPVFSLDDYGPEDRAEFEIGLAAYRRRLGGDATDDGS